MPYLYQEHLAARMRRAIILQGLASVADERCETFVIVVMIGHRGQHVREGAVSMEASPMQLRDSIFILIKYFLPKLELSKAQRNHGLLRSSLIHFYPLQLFSLLSTK